jgi:RNA polymerase subunit RPABC4/transcription elongation factor Spt4
MMLIVLPLLMQLRRRPTCSLQKDRLVVSPTKMICLICKSLTLTHEFLGTLVFIFNGSCAISDEGFVEPPLKKAKATFTKPAPAASKASAPASTPAAQLSTASSLFKGK